MSSENLLERIGEGRPLVSDGASGSLLIARGLRAGMCPEVFNVEKPEVLEGIARAYVEAGADIVHTNTFGGSSLKLQSHRLGDKVESINRNAVAAVRKAVANRAVVALSCGPSGMILKPYGDADPDVLYESFEQQIGIGLDAGVEAITVETMIDLEEAKLAVKAARSVSSSIPILATMTFDPTPRGFFTVMGTGIEQAARGLEEVGADVVGSNCGNGIEKMVEIARELKKVTNLPILIQSNAGLPELRDGAAVYPESPDFMAEKAKELIELGVEIIGGCCGTTPEHIRALRQIVDGIA